MSDGIQFRLIPRIELSHLAPLEVCRDESVSIDVGSEIERLRHKVADCGTCGDVALVLELAEIASVHDNEPRLSIMRACCGHDIVASPILCVSVVGHAHCLTQLQIRTNLLENVHVGIYFIVKSPVIS